jgi:amino acid adenylation domain-containing protein
MTERSREGTGPLSTAPLAFRLTGFVDVDAVWRAIQAVVRGPVDFTVTDLIDGRTTEEHQLYEVARLALAGPPATAGQATVYLIREDDCVIVLAGAEFGPDVVDRFRVQYQRDAGHEVVGPAATPQPHDEFVWWRPDGIDDERLAQLLRFWTGRLCGARSELGIWAADGLGRRRAAVLRVHDTALPDDLAVRLDNQADAAALALAALRILLWRQTGQPDLLIATPCSGPATPMPLRNPVLAGRSIGDLVAAERQAMEEAEAHAGLPYEFLVRSVRNRHEAVAAALFRYDRRTTAAFGPAMVPLSLEFLAAAHPLRLRLYHSGGALRLSIVYDSHLLDRATVERMASRYAHLLAAAVSGYGIPVDVLPALCSQDREQLRTLAGGAAREPSAGTVIDLVAETVAAVPDAVAVRDGAGELTYRDLWSVSARVAADLIATGLRPGSRVGVLLDRTAALPAVALGILRAGHAYLPLDRSQPDARLSYLLTDSGAAAVVAADPDAVPACVPVIAVWPDRPLVPTGPEVTAGSEVTVGAEQTAYVIYTSGSTGRPKGVVVPHGAFRNVLLDMRERLGAGLSQGMLAITTVTFDIAQLELFLPLVSGGTVLMVGDDDVRDARMLVRRLEQWRPGVVQATPSTWQTLIALGWPGDPGMTALSGGEALSPALAAELRARSRGVCNGYGPTETAIYSTAHWVTAGDDQTVPIGGPVAGTELYILDGALRQVPVGAIGELYIGGVGVADGYLERPALTADRFVPDPYGASPGGRIYRTGDLVRLRLDGALEYHGRIDHQIKLRGIRIEPGEIERAVLELPGIDRCVVVARPGAGGADVLVAYVVPAPPAVPTAAEVEAALANTLPRTLVPTVVLLDALPLTASGKVDRNALPDFRGPGGADSPPTNDTERALAALWTDILGIAEPPVNRDFFDLGGYSLATVRLAFGIERDFGVELALADLLQAQTIVAQAELVDHHMAQMGG